MWSDGYITAFGGLRFLQRGHADVDDPHYKGEFFLPVTHSSTDFSCLRNAEIPYTLSIARVGQVTDFSPAEVPQWVYAALFFASIGVGIGCSYAGPHGTVLMPAWSILYFTCKNPHSAISSSPTEGTSSLQRHNFRCPWFQ
jgi:hypothetical protein